jgi:hypothetical protein
VTQLPCVWSAPAEKNSTMGPIRELGLRKNQEEADEPSYSPLTLDEIKAICSEIQSAGTSAAIGPYYLDAEPSNTTTSNNFLHLLRHEKYLVSSLEELQEIGVDVDISFDKEFALEIFEKTKNQASSKDWHNIR